MEDDRPLHEITFHAAVRVIQSLPTDGPYQPSDDMMLKFYSFYKQATVGPCHIPRPGFWDSVGKVKWEAWRSLGDMPKEQAMTAYVDEMKMILETMPVTDQVEDLLNVLGPFYDYVVEEKIEDAESTCMVNGISKICNKSDDDDDDDDDNECEEDDDDDDDEEEEEEEEEEEDDDKEENEKEVCELGLMATDSWEKPQLPLSTGTGENRVSPVTDSTHSSLNSDHPEEELLVIARPLEEADLGDISDHLCDHGQAESRLRHQPSDTDSEVYCDSTEQFCIEERLGPLMNQSTMVLWGEASWLSPSSAELGVPGEGRGQGSLLGATKDVQHRGEEGMRSSALDMGPQCLLGAGDRARGGDGDNVMKHVAMTLIQLQQDMQRVLQKLRALEARAALQTKSLALLQHYPLASTSKNPSWWPFSISPGSLGLAMAWPFVVHWLVYLCLLHKRRKLR